MESRGINIGDTELIDSHVLYCRGNAWTPSRFWDYELYNINRPFDEKELIKKGYYKMDLKSTVEKYDGVGWDFLKN